MKHYKIKVQKFLKVVVGKHAIHGTFGIPNQIQNIDYGYRLPLVQSVLYKQVQKIIVLVT